MAGAQGTVEGVATGVPIPVTISETGGGVVDVAQSASGAAAPITATLPGVAGKTTYLTDVLVDGTGATAAGVVTVTITGLLGGTLSFDVNVVAGALLDTPPRVFAFARPWPASAPNTPIVVNVPSFGLGNTSALVSAHGYQA